jgi:hypothetical protein
MDDGRNFDANISEVQQYLRRHFPRAQIDTERLKRTPGNGYIEARGSVLRAVAIDAGCSLFKVRQADTRWLMVSHVLLESAPNAFATHIATAALAEVLKQVLPGYSLMLDHAGRILPLILTEHPL